MDVIQKIVESLRLDNSAVEGAVALLKEGAAVPFIARYRKERSGRLDETKLWAIQDRLAHITEFEQRRAVVLKAVADASQLTPELKEKIETTQSRAELEDVFMPFRSRRRTRSSAARQKGLEPLAELIWKQDPPGDTSRDDLIKPFIVPEKGAKDAAEALAGARDILAERVAENAACRKFARDLLLSEGQIVTKARAGVDVSKGRFATFAQFSDSVSKIPTHRLLAALHGAAEKQLALTVEFPKDKLLAGLKAQVCAKPEALFKADLELAVEEACQHLLGPALDNELRLDLKRRADLESVAGFARHLRAMLMQAPLGPQPVLALLPTAGQPWKAAVLDAAGNVAATLTVQPDKGTDEEKKAAAESVLKLLQTHAVKAVAIGNGAGSREADLFIRDLLKTNNLGEVIRILVHDGASAAYGASALAREELPELDNSLRTAVSLGRRLQDPLAELLKAELRTLGLGQYQHEVDQKLLEERLEEAAMSCVNAVGVDVNTAGPAVLRYVAGLSAESAKALVQARAVKNGFKSRDEIREVPGLSAKVLEQCLGFLRIRNEESPLDATAIHPECYAAVEALAAEAGMPVKALLGNTEALGKLDPAKFQNEQTGAATLKDILAELAHPGLDPRGAFVKPEFSEEVANLKDLKEGMVLNGVVTNVTAFGAFVDVGVHQDGLVHISAITHKFIRDPSELLTVGQHVKVKVLSVDAEKKRVSLSMKALEAAPAHRPARPPRPAGPRPPRLPRAPAPAGAASVSTEGGPAVAAPAGAAPAAGPARPPRPLRPRRFERRPAAVGTAAASPTAPQVSSPATPVDGTASAAPIPGASGATGHAPGAGSGPGRRGDRERGPRREDSRDRRAPEPKPAPGMPDYSKFFVKGKRKDRDRDKRGPRDQSGASRDEVREVLRHQAPSGTSLGDLLRKAGVDGEEKST